MPKKKNVVILSDQELNTVLAALRFYQSKGFSEASERRTIDFVESIATNEGTQEALNDDGIEKLCQRINTEDIKPIAEIFKALRSYEWNNNYFQFCADLEIPEDYYAEDRWTALGKMVQGFSLLDFDQAAKITLVRLNK